MKKQQLTSFYLEALLLVVIIVAMVLVLTAVFGSARAQSTQARQLTQAVTLAANAAEAVSASDTVEQVAAILDDGGNLSFSGDTLEASYGADGSPCDPGSGTLRLTVFMEPLADDPALIKSRITVYASDGDAPVYILETEHIRKEAEK